MNYFNQLQHKISEEFSHGSLEINKLNSVQYALYRHLTSDESGIHFFIFPSDESAEELYDAAQNNQQANHQSYFLGGFGHSPYGGHIASERTLFERFSTLGALLSFSNENSRIGESNNTLNIITTIEAVAQWLPSIKILKENLITLEVSDIISPFELKEKLVSIGYQSSTTVEEPGTFSNRGEIFDIYPLGGEPVRLNYFDDMIEEIHQIDTASNKTLRDIELTRANIPITPKFFIKPAFAQNFMSRIPNFGPGERNKFEKRKDILNKVQDSISFENYPLYLPLFFSEKETFDHFVSELGASLTLFNYNKIQDEWDLHSEQINLDYDLVNSEHNSDNILPSYEYFYDHDITHKLGKLHHISINDFDVIQDLNNKKNSYTFECETLNKFLSSSYTPSLAKEQFLNNIFAGLKEKFENRGDIVFLYTHESAKDQFDNFLEIYKLKDLMSNRVKTFEYEISQSFYYPSSDVLFLSESDLFSNSSRKAIAHKKVDYDLFAEQLATLKKGDFIVHNDHGVGKYLGLESIDMSGNTSDYLLIEYANNDKVYLPVYKMDLIQKYADSISATKLDNLRTTKFNNVKKRARESAKKLAFDLLKLQAKRASTKAYAFSAPGQLYNDFELDFPYRETTDQQQAIDSVLEDMQSTKAMDHLVCGDVGFGKTEIAMRAAFKAVEDNKQVAILVPTTILALQHHNTFKKRFEKFPVRIEFISRLKTPKESKEIFKLAEEGKIDILIGTHKILSDQIKYKDLGLVIVDEEQRFGVNHKEKLKLLKASMDFLTLTATPLPRTLQLGFLGLKDISIIKTPPAKRQSIKTYLIKEDNATLKTAIDKEIQRGGQVFIVHNKVQDIEMFSAKIRELVPQVNITIAHGQMGEKELEKRIDSFYKGDVQILIATTIIESGIDIPNANTMIVDRADQFGLSQLHQLRGRIGRSDKKAYAYFVIPNDRSLNPIAEKRLKALQMYADMGSGFNIASSDLEIRGAGDILGAHQSGQIESVGLELYMSLLKEAISELKGEEHVYNKNVEVKTPFPSYIPGQYIDNSAERLKQYKRLSNLTSDEQLDSVKQEYSDVYGPLPSEIQNLFMTFHIRVSLAECGVHTLSIVANSIQMQFDKNILDKSPKLASQVTSYFLSKPKLYRFSPDYKVLYTSKDAINMKGLVEFCRKLSNEILSKEDR
jgi:transcription-repair coupling factor (superfamily II helicase)